MRTSGRRAALVLKPFYDSLKILYANDICKYTRSRQLHMQLPQGLTPRRTGIQGISGSEQASRDLEQKFGEIRGLATLDRRGFPRRKSVKFMLEGSAFFLGGEKGLEIIYRFK